MKKVGVISLGCDKNRVDTENMLKFLQPKYQLTQKIEDAEVIIVNTCAFIGSAREEAINTIFEAVSYKPEKLIVTGCLPQKYIDEIFDELTEVDAFLGTASYASISDVIDTLYRDNKRLNCVTENVVGGITTERVITTPYHYAYLKIAEGCDNHCTYCTIPSIRGKYTSRSMGSLIEEAKNLSDSGVRELILVAQDVTRYGEDLGSNNLVELLRQLSQLPFVWIRLLYCYPENISDELLEEMAHNEKIVKYFDIPMQHVNSHLLKLMGRKVDSEFLSSLVVRIRRSIPNAIFRSTFIVGFPTETEQQFEELCNFLIDNQLDNVGFFAYSREDGTAASRLSGQIDETVKRDRECRAYEVQRLVVAKKNAEKIGKTITVVFEGLDHDEQAFYGRSYAEAPDIDGKIYLSSKQVLNVGCQYDAVITDYNDYDLYGEVK